MSEITISLQRSAYTAPILNGDVTSDLPVRVLEASSIDANTRAMLDGRFDVGEMSLATFVWARIRRATPLLALPIFTGRRFPHAGAYRHSDDDLTVDGLAGRRVAVPQYWMTSSVWHRDVLLRQYGVDPTSVHWVMTAKERGVDLVPPAGVSHEVVADSSPLTLLNQRRVDAILLPRKLRGDEPARTPLFPDAEEASRRYADVTGTVPVLHLVVVREELASSDPVGTAAVTELFSRAASAAGGTTDTLPTDIDGRSTVRAFLHICHQQGLLDDVPRREDLFVDVEVRSRSR